jgi:molybdenum cofactor biosynthesis protein MoaC
MLDLTDKYPTLRTAVAESVVRLRASTLKRIQDHNVPKGDPFEIARAAAVMAAKNTPGIIPYCHPIAVTFVGVEFDAKATSLHVVATVKALAITGVEMEAMTAASVAALTIYDMLKMLDESMEIKSVRLVSKTGGKGEFREPPVRKLRAGVLVMSDSVAAGKRKDISGHIIRDRLNTEGLEVVEYSVIPDTMNRIVSQLCRMADTAQLDLIVTTGGTGFGPRDHTPEAMKKVIDREATGIVEAIRSYGQVRTPYAMLSRGIAGLRGKTLIVNLPGSTKAVAESLNLLLPALLHVFKMIHGQGSWAEPPVKGQA